MNASRPRAAVDPDATPIPPLFILTFLFSVATAVMWNGLGFVAKSSYAFPEWKTSLLFVVNGVIYALGAFGCGRGCAGAVGAAAEVSLPNIRKRFGRQHAFWWAWRNDRRGKKMIRKLSVLLLTKEV